MADTSPVQGTGGGTARIVVFVRKRVLGLYSPRIGVLNDEPKWREKGTAHEIPVLDASCCHRHERSENNSRA